MTVPTLAPLVHPLVREFLDAPGLPAALAARHGSPLAVVFPQVFTENVERLGAAVARHGVRSRIWYAHKANASASLARAACRAGIGIDVASRGELASALTAGFPPDRIEATGPKGERFLADLAAIPGVTVNVDNPWELQRLVALTAGHRAGRRPILLRLSGADPAAPGPTRPTRFGMSIVEARTALATVAAEREAVDLAGVSFHIDSSDTGEKVRAAEAGLDLVEHAYALGLTPRVLDVGGGLRQVFTADPAGFDTYVDALKRGLVGRGPALTWAGATLGFEVSGGSVRGVPVFHKYGATQDAAASLADLLTAPLLGQGGRRIADVLRDNLLELWLEPGKALADQAGVTVATVEVVRAGPDGHLVVVLDISRDTVSPADQEVMIDPILLPRDPRRDAVPCTAFLAGRLCLERDMVTTHVTAFPATPEPGDLVAFVNTAAYNMDLSAAAAALHPTPVRLSAVRTGTAFDVRPDGEDTNAGTP